MSFDWGYAIVAAIVFVASSVVSLVLVTIVIVALPDTYFLKRPARQLWVDQHPVVRIALHVVKNGLGVLLIAAGALLSVPGIPGQGMLIMLIGLLLLDFPGKHQLQRKFASHPRVLSTINGIRRRFGKRPMQLGEDDDS